MNWQFEKFFSVRPSYARHVSKSMEVQLNMKKYELRVVSGLKAVFSGVAFAFLFLFTLILVKDVDNLFFKILIFIFILGSFAYLVFKFCSGKILVLQSATSLNFKWINKPLFDFRNLYTLRINEIIKIVVDENKRICKLATDQISIKINTFKQNNDEVEFLDYLNKISKENNFQIIDSWDEWNEKGYLRIAYRINQAIIVFVGLLFLYAIIANYFKSIHVLILIFMVGQLISYHFVIKSKIGKNQKLANTSIK
jgi:hypothetical protein